MPSSHVKAIEDYLNLKNRNAQTQAIRAAVKLGIINSLRSGQKNCIQLAEANGCKTIQVEQLMAILAMRFGTNCPSM